MPVVASPALRRPLLPALLLLLVPLAGCAGALSHIETQKRLDATYAGFPPVLEDPALAAYRTRYMADRAAMEADRDAFLMADAPGIACALPPATVEGLAESAFRWPIQERSPDYQDHFAKAGLAEGAPVFDQAEVALVRGDCRDGVLDGPAVLRISFVRVAKDGRMDQYRVSEVTAREDCTFARSVRHGECTRYLHVAAWDGKMTADGRLVPWLQALHEQYPTIHPKPESHAVETFTTADYGRFEHGIEAGPGVAFETSPVIGDKVNAVANGTLTRLGTPDGRVRYTEYVGGTRKLTYLLRDGVAHGPLQHFQPQLSGEQQECFVDGEKVLTTRCEV
ncbi:hypothetical protein SH611_17325 [Geminicoccaceae bacterium 1502E]|nr:hypothetical protein [Geminicoccaceae bacterium 1502E]